MRGEMHSTYYMRGMFRRTEATVYLEKLIKQPKQDADSPCRFRSIVIFAPIYSSTNNPLLYNGRLVKMHALSNDSVRRRRCANGVRTSRFHYI